ISIPVHGEYIHTYAHAKFAKECGVAKAIMIKPGDIINLEDGEKVNSVNVDYFGIDGRLLRYPESNVIKMRRAMRDAGIILVTAVANRRNALLAKPKVYAPGVLEPSEDAFIIQKIIAKVEQAFNLRQTKEIKNKIESSVLSVLKEYLLKKPIVEVCIEKDILYVDIRKKDTLYVDIKKNSTDNINLVVSVSLCNTDLENKLSERMTKVIKKNLSHCGLFSVKHNSTINNDALVTINLSEISDRKLKLSFSLLDAFTTKELISKSMIFSEKEWREISHLVSDMIHDRLTGEKGHFGTKITYIAEEKDNNYKSIRRIAIMNRDGSNIKYLTNGDKFVSTPRFSPNGRGIVYVSYINGESYITLKNLIDNTESVVNVFEGVISAPRFSPDGKSLLVSHSLDGVTNILSLDLNSKRTSKITKNSAINTSPSLSPDQNYMVFSSDISG
ncbi:TolB, N-terminal,Metallo-beta-lactamase,WD40-like Beta Propeller, partial [Cinara cedri]